MKAALFFWLMLGLAAADAQEERLVLDPPLREAFPLAPSPGGVGIKYPVLLNDHTILRPGAILHFIYLDAAVGSRDHAGDDSGNGFRSHIGPGGAIVQGGDDKMNGGGAAGGWGNHDGDENAGIFDGSSRKEDAKQRKSELQTEVWTRPELFTDALDHATELGTTVVYRLPAQNKPQTAALDLPEGMLLGEVGGGVRVLGLSEKSRAYAGGLRPGDEIQSLNGGARIRTLDDFIRGYVAAKHQARAGGHPTYAMEVGRGGQSVSIQVAAPPSIPSFF